MGLFRRNTTRFFAVCAMGTAMGLPNAACNNAGTIISGYSVGEAQSTTGGASDDGYPQGAHMALLQVADAGGQVMQAPVLQVISFNQDPNAEMWESFVASLAHSSYWATTTAEYGVGLATAPAPVRATLTASSQLGYNDGALARGETSDIEAFLTAQLDVANPPLGAPSTNTLYILFMPPGMAVSLDAKAPIEACADGVLSWHTAMRLPQTQTIIAYVVVPDCGLQLGASGIDSRTIAASHAIIEAVTDPHIDAYAGFDANHIGWQLPAHGAEVAAACTAALYGDPNLFVTPLDLGFAVQRTWSNAQANFGHAPCVPAPHRQVSPYFDSVPLLTQTIALPLGPSLLDPNVTMAGVTLAAGASTTVPLQLFSDAATPGPWSVVATEIGTSQLSLSTDKAQGNNGDTITLSILAKAGATHHSVVRVASGLGTQTHSQWLVVEH